MDNTDAIRQKLKAAGDKLLETKIDEFTARRELEALVPEAVEAGLSITEISHLGTITRPTVYRIVRDAPSK